ncbi:MAG: META domain-containing protein [Novosphingobium sp.]
MNRRILAVAAALAPLFLTACAATGSGPDNAGLASAPSAESAVISGSIFYRERMLLPPGSTAQVTLIDGSIADRAAPVLAQADYSVGTAGGPFGYRLSVPASALLPQGRYFVRATIRDQAQRLLWTSDTATPIDPALRSQTLAPILLVKVGHDAAIGPGPWRVRSIGGVPALDPAAPTIRFGADGRVNGSTGCNAFSGTFETSGDTLTIGALAMTRRACPGPIGVQEQKFVSALAAVAAYRSTASGGMALVGPGDAVIELDP